MTGFVLGLCFATGVALVWLGGTGAVRPPAIGAPVRRLLGHAEVGMHPALFVSLVVACAMLVGAIVWSIVEVPILAVAGLVGGAYLPVAFAGARRERRRRERERAWPAALAQLADALEAGIAFPAAVVLVAEGGPQPLRREFGAFHARMRAGGLAAAVDALAAEGDRTADTVALLLRAGLLDLPAGGLAPVLRELAGVLSERFEVREKACSRASSLRLEAAILALSPVALLLLVGLASPGYLDAYRTAGGTVVGALGAVLIFGCYQLMRRLGRVPEPRRTAGGT